MSTREHDPDQEAGATDAEESRVDAAEAVTAVEDSKSGQDEKVKVRLDLDVQIADSGPCKKHVKVTIPRSDIERQFEDSLGNIKKEAQVPGFRPGRAPRSLVQRRFRKEMADQVKSTLLVAALEQLDEDHQLNPISQPELDLGTIELPEEGPMVFEMNLEVQPDFDLPDYKSLVVQRPVREIGEADVEVQLKAFLERYAQLVPKLEGGAELGDQITADLRFHRDGIVLNEAKEVQFRLQPELRFQDGHVPDLEKALAGVRPEQTREAEAKIGSSSPDPALRNQTIRVSFQVHDLKSLRLPEIDEVFLASIGFDSEAELRQALREVLERRVEFQQRQAMRRQIVDRLIEQVPFDLPEDLVQKQEKSTLQRQINEMRENGFTDSEIRAREAEIRANAHESTLLSLKEFFLLSKIADAEGIKVDDDDLNMEIASIAARSDESPRRVRSRLEKEGLIETLATQILERKAIGHILEQVTIEDIRQTGEQESVVETLDQTVTSASAEEPAEDESSSEPVTDADPGASKG
ncbi:trigger factor [soil metagenome]